MQLPSEVINPALNWLNNNFTLDQVDPDHLDFGSPDQKFEFPTLIEPLDDLVLNEHLIVAVQQLLDSVDIRLLQADLWPKIGVESDNHDAQANTDQRMHMDYGNNTLLHPDWQSPEAVAAIIYYDDSLETAGGTAYVPRKGDADHVYQPPFIHMPGQAEKLVEFNPGTILFYRHDLWHRGTPVAPGKLRRVQNLAWRRSDARGWSNWNQGWARQSYYGHVESIIGRSTPLQRSLLDFPMPGDRYWTPQRIDQVEARFGFYGFDSAPYRQAL